MISALLAMVTPSVAASTSPIRSNTASRSPATVKPVLSGADVADAPTEERLTDCVVSPPGSFIAPEVSGSSEEHTSELQSLMRSSYSLFCLKKKNLNDHLLILK